MFLNPYIRSKNITQRPLEIALTSSGFLLEVYMEVKEVAKIYKEIESKFNGNLAAMYQYADSIYGELAEKNTDEKKIHLYLMVRDVISHNIVSEYMKGNGYIFDEDTQSWIPKKVIFTLNI